MAGKRHGRGQRRFENAFAVLSSSTTGNATLLRRNHRFLGKAATAITAQERYNAAHECISRSLVQHDFVAKLLKHQSLKVGGRLAI
jgi:hypothetical protein